MPQRPVPDPRKTPPESAIAIGLQILGGVCLLAIAVLLLLHWFGFIGLEPA